MSKKSGSDVKNVSETKSETPKITPRMTYLSMVSIFSTLGYFTPIMFIFMTITLWAASSTPIEALVMYLMGCLGIVFFNHLIGKVLSTSLGTLFATQGPLNPMCHFFNTSSISVLDTNLVVGSGLSVVLYTFCNFIWGMFITGDLNIIYTIFLCGLTFNYISFILHNQCLSTSSLVLYIFLTLSMYMGWYFSILQKNPSANIFATRDPSNRKQCRQLKGENKYKCTLMKNGEVIARL